MPPAVAAAGITGAATLGSAAYSAHKQGQAAKEDREAQANQQTHLYDPTNPLLRGLASQQVDFLGRVFGGYNPFANQAAGVNNSLDMVRQNAISGQPEAVAQAAVTPMLQQLMSGPALANPFSQMGHTNPGQSVVDAATPVFNRNLRLANAQLANTAPGRFSTAFDQQGIGLNQQALQDFNLFVAQQLAQGEQLRAQQQQQALQFMLGAGQLQQQGQLGAAQLMGQLAGQAGAAQRGALTDYAGLQQSAFQALTNPLLQLMLGGMQYAAPSDINAIVGGKGFAPGGVYAPTGTVGAPPQQPATQGRFFFPSR